MTSTESPVMSTKQQIENTARVCCPLVFWNPYAVPEREFLQKYDALADSAAGASASFLSPDAIRYQSLLLYSSLIFLSVSLFKFNTVKILENSVAVDRRLYALYTTFMVLIALLFVLKAYADALRTQAAGTKHALMTRDFTEMMRVGILRRHIQHYFWLELSDAIGRAYQVYEEALSRAAGQTNSSTLLKMNALTIDRAAIRKTPELAPELEFQECVFESLAAKLAKDEASFKAAVEANYRQTTPPGTPNASPHFVPDADVRTPYEQFIRPWIDARIALLNESYELTMSKGDIILKQSNAILSVIKRMRKVRFIYNIIEIMLPLVFAACTIAYAWKH